MHIDAQAVYAVAAGILYALVFFVGLLRESPTKAALRYDIGWLQIHLTPDTIKAAINDLNDPVKALQDAAKGVGITVSDQTAKYCVAEVQKIYRSKI